MLITQKCQYGLRAIFELAARGDDEPVPVAEIAAAQAIPPRFLEVILGQLKQGGFVASRRGSRGGYLLARSPQTLTVGEVIRFIQGPTEPVRCVSEEQPRDCPLRSDCVFLPMWEEAAEAISEVFDRTTFGHLIEAHRRKASQYVADFAI